MKRNNSDKVFLFFKKSHLIVYSELMEHEHELEKEFNCKEKQMLFENDQKAILSPNQQPTELNEFSLESSSSPLPSTSSPSSSMNSRPNTSKRKSKERSIFPLF